MSELFERALREHRAMGDFVMVTVVEVSGSVPTDVGSRMLVLPDETVGTIGGGALEKNAVEKARAMLSSEDRARIIQMGLSDLDMTCGGNVSVFFEPFQAATELWIFGGGHIAKALVPIAVPLGFTTTVVDNRPDFATADRFPEARPLCSDYREAARQVPAGAYAVIATHGHEHDAEVFVEIVRKDPPLSYIGMIGSGAKVSNIFNKLEASGIRIGPNVYSPIGLELGGNTPAEIALAIAAELLGVRNEKPGMPHCRDRLLNR
ncbi:MAG: XdhC family protein [Myxococcota bacterium]|nr:XdhC family protein [Myxococcota bacterium]